MSGLLHGGSNGSARLVERQLRNWELGRAQQPAAATAGGADVHDFITISRMVGSGGEEFASEIAEQLQLPVFDREILQRMSGDDAMRQRIYTSMDERDLGWLEEALRAVLQAEFVRNDYFHQLVRTVLALARKAPAVFLGRAADLILPAGRGLRIRITAPLDACVETYARRMHMPREIAATEVDRIERERRGFALRHFHRDPADPARHDLQLNLGVFTLAEAVELALHAVRTRKLFQKPAA